MSVWRASEGVNGPGGAVCTIDVDMCRLGLSPPLGLRSALNGNPVACGSFSHRCAVEQRVYPRSKSWGNGTCVRIV